MSFEPTAPPPAPDLSGTSESWPRRHPWLMGIAAVVLIASCSAATSGGNDTPTDGATSAQAPEPEPAETVTVEADPEPAETVTVEAEPEPAETVTVDAEPETDGPLSAHVPDEEYDAVLDALADACVDGDEDACTELFWDSELDSTYEQIGQDGTFGDLGDLDLGDLDLGDVDLDDLDDLDASGTLQELGLQLMWDSMGPDDQETICFGWNAAEDVMLESFLDGSEDAFDEGQVRDFFDSVC